MVPPEDRDAAFTSFVTASRPQLAKIAYLMCGDWHQAEDLVQTVLGRAYPRWANICRTGEPYAYVRRGLLNALTDERRRPWRRERPVGSLSDEDYPGSLGLAVSNAATDGVFAALERLPVRQRAVVVLRYIEDLPVGAVAAELQISEGTVKSQAARGLAALRQQLLGEPVGDKTRTTTLGDVR